MHRGRVERGSSVRKFRARVGKVDRVNTRFPMRGGIRL